MVECNKKYDHRCNVEGTHVKNCECIYGFDLDDDHGLQRSDPKCRALKQKRLQENLDNASKSMKWHPRYQRNDKRSNAQDELKDACWNLKDRQILEIVKYIKETYG